MLFWAKSYNNNMAKDIVQITIKRIPLEVDADGLSTGEITALAEAVENRMAALQEEGKIDTLSQALHAALYFARQYEQLKQREKEHQAADDARKETIIRRLRDVLKDETPAPEKPHE